MDNSAVSAPTVVEPSRLRISLRQLFLSVAAVAALLAPYYWFGIAYLVSAIFSVALIFCCTAAYRRTRAGAICVAVGGAIAGFVLAIVMMVYFCHAALNVLLCAILCGFRLRPRMFSLALLTLMVLVYGYAFSQGALAFREIRALQAKYPFISLRERLAFERHNSGDKIQNPSTQLSPAVAKNLDEQDKSQEFRFYSRSGALRELHEESYREFARAAGFGFMRMDSLRSRLVREIIQFRGVLPTTLALPNSKTRTQGLFEVHTTAIYDFISPPDMGYVKNRNEVAGFQSHRFGVGGWNNPWHEQDTSLWTVVTLLVGLLRSNEPRVYMTTTPFTMENLNEVPHRALNDFEKTALPTLGTQDDIVVSQQHDRILMLGAVWAGTTCLQCHEGERGKLLGAFSYELVPQASTGGSSQRSLSEH